MIIYNIVPKEQEKKIIIFIFMCSKIRKHFVEEEAELSGSEYGSDEDLDLDEHDDVMEEELGDLEDLPSDDELRNQVGRVHL